MKKFKILIFILLIISFIVVLFYGIFGTNISYLNVDEIKSVRTLKEDLVTYMNINNIDTIYDKKDNIYYLSVLEDHENKLYVLNFKFNENFKVKLVNENFNLIRVKYEEPINIIIYNDKYYMETKIQLTNLPLINIITEEKITTSYSNSTFKYISSKQELDSNIKINIRGSSSLALDKKSYKIKMYNNSYTNEKNINLSNFYNGNSFVLDAVYRDPSKIRNVISTEIWNDVSNDFSNTDIYSEFVELFINNEYMGLYVLTEPINRRKLNLNKSNNTDSSILVKVQEWRYIDSSINVFNIDDNSYYGFELKYPNDEELFSISWETILSKIVKYYDNEMESDYETISSTFNLESYIDMIIFNAFTNNNDNKMRKNNYLYMESFNSNEVYIQPWDMEFTFGTKYEYRAVRNLFKNMNNYNEIETGFYHENAPEINKLLIKRYWELRENIFTKEYFDGLLNKYKSQLTKGAALRESNKWYKYDIEKEIEEIRTWIYNRIDFFDKYVESLENE